MHLTLEAMPNGNIRTGNQTDFLVEPSGTKLESLETGNNNFCNLEYIILSISILYYKKCMN
jgi:hypothetical protein